ncbi:MAG TPA: hypothetical protein VGN57_15500 [Pirellulaceae bacterium]|nr:hypothetical protein [Pirellulaceae bacterium]
MTVALLLVSFTVDVAGAVEPLAFQTELLATWDRELKTMSSSGCIQMTFCEKKSPTTMAGQRDSLRSFFKDAPSTVHRYCYVEDGVCLYFNQENGQSLVHLDNPQYFAAVQADRAPDGTLSGARIVRTEVKSAMAAGRGSVESALSESARRVADEAKMPSVSFAGHSLSNLLKQGILQTASVELHPESGRTEIVLDVLDREVLATTSLRDVLRIRLSLIDSLGFAPEYAESLEVAGKETRSLKLYWVQRRDQSGKTVPEMHASMWELRNGIVIGIRLADYSFDADPSMASEDFTLAKFGLPEPPGILAAGSYRTQPWLYYFFGGVLCVAIGAFFVHRTTQGRSAA